MPLKQTGTEGDWTLRFPSRFIARTAWHYCGIIAAFKKNTLKLASISSFCRICVVSSRGQFNTSYTHMRRIGWLSALPLTTEVEEFISISKG